VIRGNTATYGILSRHRSARETTRVDALCHPVAAEQIEDHIQPAIEIRDRPLQFRDVLGPDLIRRRRHELRFGARPRGTLLKLDPVENRTVSTRLCVYEQAAAGSAS
jgi:hypothetical protein